MIVTGLYLWWPQKVKTMGGIVYPRLGADGRMFWRDLHSVTGFWISGLALFLLLSGLPWAKFWGDYFRNVRRLTGTAVARQDWTNGQASTAERRSAASTGEHGDHRARSGQRRRRRVTPSDLTAVDRIVATLRPLDLPAPVVITPPAQGSGDWTVKSMTPNRPRRVDLVIDGATGAIKGRTDFKDRHLIDRIVGTGIAAHEGQLFGWTNQLLGLVTAVGLILLSVSSVVMWWRRREPGILGAPGRASCSRFSAGLFILVVLFGIYPGDLSDGVAVLVGVLGEQSGEVAFESLGSLAPLEVEAEGGRGTRPVRAEGCRGRVGFGSSSYPYYEFCDPRFS